MLNEIFRLFGTIVVDNESAKKNIDETVEYAEDQRSKLQIGLETFGKGALAFGAAFATAAVSVGTALYNITTSTQQYRQEMAKLDTAFILNGLTADDAQSVYDGLIAVVGETDQVVEAAGHIAALSENMEDLQRWVNVCTGAYATFGTSMQIENLTEAARETANTGTLTGDLIKALDEAGVSGEDFQDALDDCNTRQERASLIVGTLNAAYSHAAETYRKNAAAAMETNSANDALTKSTAAMGDAWQPAANAINREMANIQETTVPALQTISDWIEKVCNELDELRTKQKIVTWEDAANDAAKTSTALGSGVGMGYGGGGSAFVEQKIFMGGDTVLKTLVPGFASGLDFVPDDDMPARLHYGEAVLTRSEANAWRRGQTGGIDYDRLAEAMAARPMAFNIDSKAFAVMLAREMNRAIGNRNIQTLMAMGG